MTIEIILAIGIVLAVVALVWLVAGRGANSEKMAALNEKMEVLANQNNELRALVDEKLRETYQASQNQYQNTMNTVQSINQLLTDVTKNLAELQASNKQILGFSSQLQNLQDILRNPKQRGVLGEYFLEEILKNVLPPGTFQMQYQFANGEIVDAVIFVKDKIIPIDSKFSLENYEKIINTSDPGERLRLEKLFRQDLKNRIDETSKYVRPEVGTMDFAFMFIPSEAIYYDLLVNKVGAVQIDTRDLIEYAFRDRHVIIVSPTSFLAYLQTVLQGLKALQIEENAKIIKSNVEKLARHLNSYEDFLRRLGGSLGTAVNHYNQAYQEFKKVDRDIVKITESNHQVEPVALERPNEE
ncbi:MAG TPA: DNA recombination protein RmuC [bacterium]|jgi:DNA recombination protein RmuC|nr:DNA recombination protein RmuC [bacterium]HQB26577.1 DNA recombination protein RmuC [bacterium]